MATKIIFFIFLAVTLVESKFKDEDNDNNLLNDWNAFKNEMKDNIEYIGSSVDKVKKDGEEIWKDIHPSVVIDKGAAVLEKLGDFGNEIENESDKIVPKVFNMQESLADLGIHVEKLDLKTLYDGKKLAKDAAKTVVKEFIPKKN